MQEWWEKSMSLISNLKMTQSDYAKIVLSSKILFRDGIYELMKTTAKNDIPLYIVSGGILEVIEASFASLLLCGDI